VSFTPHLLPLTRGLFTTASVPLATSLHTADLVNVYREFYAGEPSSACSARRAADDARVAARTSAT